MLNNSFNCLQTVKCVSHFEFLTCIPFLTEKATPTSSLHVVQNCNGLDSDQSFDVTVCLRHCHSMDFDIVTAWLRQFNCKVNAFFHYICFIVFLFSYLS